MGVVFKYMTNTDNEDRYEKELEVSKMINKITDKNTPWVWFAIGLIVFLFGKYDIFSIVGICILVASFHMGGKQLGHALGFEDGWNKLENRK